MLANQKTDSVHSSPELLFAWPKDMVDIKVKDQLCQEILKLPTAELNAGQHDALIERAFFNRG